MKKINYRMGLDIGIASVGWAVLENNDRGEPCRIEDLGVRIFDAAEVPKTGDSLAAPRRNARCTRRRLRRRRHRLDRIKYLFQIKGIIDINKFSDRYYKNNLPDVYALRYEGLDRRLTDEEFAQVLLHIAKHRGFKSTRKAELTDKETGKVLSATKSNMEIMEKKGYRTVGEMIYLDDEFKTSTPWRQEGYILTPRNKQDDYRHTILRDMLVDEVKLLFEVQREKGNEKATQDLLDSYLDIMLGQRSFDLGPGNQPDGSPSPYGGNLIEAMVGKCSLDNNERRAAKACYTSERFVLLQRINNIKIIDKDRKGRFLNKEQRKAVMSLAYSKKEVKYSEIRKKLDLEESNTFNEINYGLKDIKLVEEKTKFVSMEWSNCYKKIFGIEDMSNISEEKVEILDKIGNILTFYKNDDSRIEKLKEIEISYEAIEKLLELSPAKFQHLSLKVMKRIMGGLEDGLIYSQACKEAGYDFNLSEEKEKSVLLKGEVVTDILEEIPNPVVRRSISQTIKVINAIIREYGSPQAVSIELSREMSKNAEERRDIENENKKNQDNNEKIRNEIIEEYGVKNPKGQDIVKYKLWKDQGEICIYTGDKIHRNELFNDGVADIDHIIPYSISFDDRYVNKVLVKASCNREKADRIPYEYLGSSENRWNKFEALVNSQIKDYRKRNLLLKKEFTEEERKAFKERNLTDTKYITTVVFNLIRNNLYIEESDYISKADRVSPVNGAITSYLRKRWGLSSKSRDTDRHHAVDAVVVACCTRGMIQRISRSVKERERKYARGFEFVDEETGDKLNQNNFTYEQWDNKFGAQIPRPWRWFKEELEMRMSDNPMYFIKDLYKMGYAYNEKIDPIFISRMPKRKVTGAIHAETIRSPRHFEDEGIVVYKTGLVNLKLNKEGEIEGYYNPSSDVLLYEALKDRIKRYDGKASEAFKEPFYKPKSDGSQGPVVKKVKLFKKQTLGVYVNQGKGIAENANGSMIRIDVFRENGKYYFVPIYTSDTIKEVLPNKAVVAFKPYSKWKIMKEENFIFSLYSRDLISFRHKKGMKAKTTDSKEIIINECITYYISANISTASIKGIAHDSSYVYEGLGIQSLEYLKKYQVDILGNVSEVKKEKRLQFNHPNLKE